MPIDTAIAEGQEHDAQNPAVTNNVNEEKEAQVGNFTIFLLITCLFKP